MNQKKMKESEMAAALQSRLNAICMEACEDEINKEEIDSIISSLEELHPLAHDSFFSASASYQRFREKYLFHPDPEGGEILDLIKQLAEEVDENNAPQRIPGKVRFFRTRGFRRFSMTAALMAVMFFALNLGTLATAKMNIFEYILRASTGQEFLITENTDTVAKKERGVWVYHDVNELQDLEAEHTNILFPQYVPNGMVFSGAELIVLEEQNIFNITYNDTERDKALNIYMIQYDEIGWQKSVHTEDEFLCAEVIEDKNVEFYLCKEELMANFFYKNTEYRIFGEVEKEELVKIIEELTVE